MNDRMYLKLRHLSPECWDSQAATKQDNRDSFDEFMSGVSRFLWLATLAFIIAVVVLIVRYAQGAF